MTDKVEAAGGSKSDAKPPYKQTPTETEAVNAVLAAQKKRGPRLKVAVTGKDTVKTEVDHPDSVIGVVALMRALGTTDFDFYNGLLGQLLNASKEKEVSESGTNSMLSVIKGIDPRDQTEAMLAAQMAAVHMASMTFARRWRTSRPSRNKTAPRMPLTSSLARSRPKPRHSSGTGAAASRR